MSIVMKAVLVPIHDALSLSHGMGPYKVPGLYFPHDGTLIVYSGSRGEERRPYVVIEHDCDQLEEVRLPVHMELPPSRMHEHARRFLDEQSFLRAGTQLLGPADAAIETRLISEGWDEREIP